jgi:putative transposase
VKVRDGHQVRNRAAHIAVGVDLDGIKHVLGIWVQASEGAKFWAGVCAELRNRGIRDVLIVCCDGLSGFPEAIEATWPQTIVQTCTVHLLRAAMRFVSYNDRKRVAAALRPIYTAPTDEAARVELDAFAGSELGRRYPAAVMAWENAWERIIGVPGVPARAPEDHLYDERDRVAELPAAEDHQEPGALPERRRRDQAVVAGDPRHRGQTRPRPGEGERPTGQRTQGPGPARRRSRRPGLETSPGLARPGLPRAHQPLPDLTNS